MKDTTNEESVTGLLITDSERKTFLKYVRTDLKKAVKDGAGLARLTRLYGLERRLS